MSLLDDTLRDARRPLVLHRSSSQRAFAAADEATPAPVDDAWADERTYPGDRPQPVAREIQELRDDDRDDFRREGQSLPREASSPFGSGFGRLPAGDPLSAVMGAERPKSSAKNVGFSDVTVMGDSRTSELATGPEKGRSPGKVAAAAAGSESMALQSDVLLGSSEAEWSRARSLSMAPEGSTTMVSAGGETFLSRPPGRGAPSENPHTASIERPLQAAVKQDRDAVPPHGVIRHASGSADISDPLDIARFAPPARKSTATNASPPSNAPAGGPQSGRADDALPAPASAAKQRRVPVLDVRDAPATNEVFARPQANTGASAGDSVPTLRIGRIDVTVVADAVAGHPDAPASFPEAFGDAGVHGFLACNYLKRL